MAEAITLACHNYLSIKQKAPPHFISYPDFTSNSWLLHASSLLALSTCNAPSFYSDLRNSLPHLQPLHKMLALSHWQIYSLNHLTDFLWELLILPYLLHRTARKAAVGKGGMGRGLVLFWLFQHSQKKSTFFLWGRYHTALHLSLSLSYADFLVTSQHSLETLVPAHNRYLYPLPAITLQKLNVHVDNSSNRPASWFLISKF